MQLTWLFLLAWLQIYCNSALLSLPPSLIARAASERLQRLQQQRAWKWQEARAEPQTAMPLNALANTKTDVGDGSLDDIDAASNRVRRRGSNIISRSGRNKHNNIQSGRSSMPRTSASLYGTTSNIYGNGKENEGNYKDNDNHKKRNQKQQDDLSNLQEEYEVNSLLGTGAQDEPEITPDLAGQPPEQTPTLQSQSPSPQAIAPRIRAIEWNEFAAPMKYWPRHRSHSTADDCPKETSAEQRYMQRASNRCQADGARHADLAHPQDPAAFNTIDIDTDTEARTNTDPNDYYYPLYGHEDSLALLSGEEDLIKFLHWALFHLKPPLTFENASRHGVGVDTKPNLSGRREAPLLVEEPRYTMVRRESSVGDIIKSPLLHKGGDPFIPPRGRKSEQQSAALETLLHRFEPFVPNRGRRDQIKDILKNDDLFFPHRGKKQKSQQHEEVQWIEADRYQRGQQQQRDVKRRDVTEEDFTGYTNEDKVNRDTWTVQPPTTTSPQSHAKASRIQPTAASSDAYRRFFARNHLCCDAPKNCLKRQKTFDRHSKPVAIINAGKKIALNRNNNHIDTDDFTAEWQIQPRSTMSTDDVKINEYDDQSVKTSMPTKAMIAAAEAEVIKDQQQRQWLGSVKDSVAIPAATEEAANRLHPTKQQQQPVKQYFFKSTKFINWLFGHPSPRQQQQQQLHLDEPKGIRPLPLMLLRQTLQSLQRSDARRSPPETQLAAMDIKQQQRAASIHRQQQPPATFIDGIDYAYNYNK